MINKNYNFLDLKWSRQASLDFGQSGVWILDAENCLNAELLKHLGFGTFRISNGHYTTVVSEGCDPIILAMFCQFFASLHFFLEQNFRKSGSFFSDRRSNVDISVVLLCRRNVENVNVDSFHLVRRRVGLKANQLKIAGLND